MKTGILRQHVQKQFLANNCVNISRHLPLPGDSLAFSSETSRLAICQAYLVGAACSCKHVGGKSSYSSFFDIILGVQLIEDAGKNNTKISTKTVPRYK